MALPALKVTCITVVLCLSGCFHFGYQLIILNPTQSMLRDFVNSSFENHYGYWLSDGSYRILWAFILNTMTFGCAAGTFISQKTLPRIGRIKNFGICIIISSIGCSISAVSYYFNSWELLALGRLISGTAMGCTLSLQPIFFTEISTDRTRGFLNGMIAGIEEIGFSLGSVIALPIALGTENLWPWLFWIELIPNFITLAILPFLRESPKYLLANRNDYDGAKKSLVFYQHTDITHDINVCVKEIDVERHLLKLADILRKPYLRKGLLISVLTQIAVQFSGIGAISYFSTDIFIQAGVSSENALYGTVGVSLQSTISAILGSFIIDRVGRRPLILLGFLILDVVNIIFVIFLPFTTSWSGYVCIVSAVLFNFIFGLGPAIIQWFIVAELMPQNAKTTAISVTMYTQWISFIASTFLFLPLGGVCGSYSFFLFIIPLTIITVYFYFAFPETKNKSILDIIQLMGCTMVDDISSSSSKEKLDPESLSVKTNVNDT